MRKALLLFLLLPLTASAKKPTAADAAAFTNEVNARLKALTIREQTAEWVEDTYITDDTERMTANANDELLSAQAGYIKESAKFQKLHLDPQVARMLHILRVMSPIVVPSDPKKSAETADLLSKMAGLYGKGKYCPPNKGGKCLDLQQLEDVMRTSRNEGELRDAWTGWHAVGKQIEPLFERFVTLSNEGAKEIGYADTGELWRDAYDMTPEAFEKDIDRLWQQLKPFYTELHCYVRAQLRKKYGAVVPESGPIPAHLLGNMWAQEWDNIYPLVEPYPGQAPLDVTGALEKQKWDAVRMAKTGENFFVSMGLDPLPKTFWERSMLTKPRDREVVCHASAWDVTLDNDLRIKMCIEPKEEDLVTIHHELGHDFYYHYYDHLPFLFQGAPNDGFHEAIGDAITLSMTPGYLKKLGLLDKVPSDDKGLINFQMKKGLEKASFLPFAIVIDKWRWEVFSGKVKPADYNKRWWELRRELGGIAPPVARSEADFDPGAKYHVPANVPYIRYFLARILQFQFHRAMCKAAGWKGPLHECSVYGNKEAGARLRAMLAMGATKPWPDALETLTGERQIDGSAMLEYFAPLRKFLDEKTAGQRCGW